MSALWFAARTRPKSEKLADHELRNQHYETFLPLINRKLISRRKPVVHQEPLYPSYIFIRFNPEIDPWWAINSTRGIKRLLTYDSMRPRPIGDGIVEELIAQSRAGGFEEIAGYVRKAFNPGVQLKIKSGPFESQTVTCLQDAVDQVLVFFNCFNREIRLNVDPANLSAA